MQTECEKAGARLLHAHPRKVREREGIAHDLRLFSRELGLHSAEREHAAENVADERRGDERAVVHIPLGLVHDEEHGIGGFLFKGKAEER